MLVQWLCVVEVGLSAFHVRAIAAIMTPLQQGVYVFYLDLVTTMLHLVVYLFFFIIVFNHYGLPLHLMRDLYWTFRNFRNRVSDFLRYRRVTVNMDSRFPEASAEVRWGWLTARPPWSTHGATMLLLVGL